jgi:hypothetical protein
MHVLTGFFQGAILKAYGETQKARLNTRTEAWRLREPFCVVPFFRLGN